MVTYPVAKNTIGYMRWEQNLCLLPEADSQMFTKALDTSATPDDSTLLAPAREWLDLAAALLIHYSFDLSGYSASELVNRWHTQYPVNWLHLAVIEALYQGRYKGFSVQQILTFWQRRGQAIFHFNMEFERLICSKFPESLTKLASSFLPPAQENTRELPPALKSLPDSSLVANVGNNYRLSNTSQKENPLLREERGHGDSVRQTLHEVRFREDFLEQSHKEKVLVSSIAVEKYNQTSDLTYAANKTSALSKSLTNSQTSRIHQSKDLSESAVNHPPIGQFTPEKSDRSELFTSKLKAIASEEEKKRGKEEKRGTLNY